MHLLRPAFVGRHIVQYTANRVIRVKYVCTQLLNCSGSSIQVHHDATHACTEQCAGHYCLPNNDSTAFKTPARSSDAQAKAVGKQKIQATRQQRGCFTTSTLSINETRDSNSNVQQALSAHSSYKSDQHTVTHGLLTALLLAGFVSAARKLSASNGLQHGQPREGCSGAPEGSRGVLCLPNLLAPVGLEELQARLVDRPAHALKRGGPAVLHGATAVHALPAAQQQMS